MIVSASYRTDIPAFYGSWFMARLEAGFCRVHNPYGGPAGEVPLAGPKVDGFVFWTRNIGPFQPALAHLKARDMPFVVQHTITGYPRALERSVIDAAQAVAQVHALARDHGPKAAVWRYDPILDSTLTPLADHPRRFARLARALEGAVDEVVISFAQIYRKTRRNLDAAARAHRFEWRDPPDAEKMALTAELASLAAQSGMRLSICAQPHYLVAGASEARCIDAERLGEIAGRKVAARAKGNRHDCRCAESRDIGDYDSCPQGCVYCYAVNSRVAARRRLAAHDDAAPFLIPPVSALSTPNQCG